MAWIVRGPGPSERRALARPFLQRLAIGCDGLFELRRPTLAFSEYAKRIAQIVLGCGPIKRHALAGLFLQCLAIGDNGLFELRRPTLAFSEYAKRTAQIVLGCGPIERHALAGYQLHQLLAPLDRRTQGTVIAAFVSLLVEGARLFF